MSNLLATTLLPAQSEAQPSLRVAFDLLLGGKVRVAPEFVCPVAPAKVTVLYGPSGSGKTTALRVLAGLERPGFGQIRFDGDCWFDAERGQFRSPQQRSVGYVPQDYALFPHCTAAQNIAFGLDRSDRKAADARVAQLLGDVGLAEMGGRYPRELSGGEQQRVALARAVARRPQLLLLDEALSALDQPARIELRGHLRRWLDAWGLPAIVVTHDRDEAIALADWLVVLEAGRTIQQGPLPEVFARPATVEAARIVGVETVVPGTIVSRDATLATVRVGNVELHAACEHAVPENVFVCIRGQDVILLRTPVETSARNQLTGTIEQISSIGSLVQVAIDCGFLLTATITAQARDELALQVGSRVTAVIKAPAIHLVPGPRGG